MVAHDWKIQRHGTCSSAAHAGTSPAVPAVVPSMSRPLLSCAGAALGADGLSLSAVGCGAGTQLSPVFTLPTLAAVSSTGVCRCCAGGLGASVDAGARSCAGAANKAGWPPSVSTCSKRCQVVVHDPCRDGMAAGWIQCRL